MNIYKKPNIRSSLFEVFSQFSLTYQNWVVGDGFDR